ncbi:MetQ/NlpA family ABC transporter substrate-binding protein [Rothia nasimurium]|uniref:MetQ/NlpA family ABC transporter substrate-binding protein n=1 Tax=Rothia nasimurium TaxID=85336 RepID=UPI003B9DEBAA
MTYAPKIELTRRQALLGSGLGLAAAFGLTACGASSTGSSSADKTITIVATESAPYQEPVLIAQEILKEQGWELKATFVTDIVQPNLEVAQGKYDVNYFQHVAYLDQFNQDKGLDNIPLFYEYTSPAGLWSAHYGSVDELPEGAKIALPVDTSNNGRGLKLLEKAGALKLTEGKPVIHLSQQDILENPKNFQFIEVDQQSLSQTYEDVDAGFLFVRLAAEIGLTPDDAIAFETTEEALPYICVVASRPDFAGTEKAKVLQEAFHSDRVREWFASYIGGVLDTPWDRDIEADIASWKNQ